MPRPATRHPSLLHKSVWTAIVSPGPCGSANFCLAVPGPIIGGWISCACMYRLESEETGKKVAFIKWVRCSKKIVGPFGNNAVLGNSNKPRTHILVLAAGCTSSRTVLANGSLSRVHVNR
jgi:hypothetical protein